MFSHREGFWRPITIVEDAPEWLRLIIFDNAIIRILDEFKDPMENRPAILSRAIMEWVSLRAHIPLEEEWDHREAKVKQLKDLLLEIPWFHFYDVLEVIPASLPKPERATSTDANKDFIESVNRSFVQGNVGWLLSKHGKLRRSRPKEITDLEIGLAAVADASAHHLNKARGFLNERPADTANAVKESVSAVESCLRQRIPETTTLGDAIKVLRQKQTINSLLLSSIEKLYGFASAEPGVRHGGAMPPVVTIVEAEFVYVTSLASCEFFKGSL